MAAMAALSACGQWLVATRDKKLVAVHTELERDPFVFDCSAAQKKPKDPEADSKGDGGATEEAGNDQILAFAASPSGNLAALTDDTKRLVLFRCDSSWRCLSTRWVVRRCTSLVFSQAEDQLLVADKSGDVYAFSVTEPRREGELKLGHLSMLLAMTLTPDDRYVITADRDEKIRVSLLRSPYNIQSFCLGHREFVSFLLIPSAHPQWLLSGSGDGTVKLWDYESGRELQSWDVRKLREAPGSEAEQEKRSAVSCISSSPDGRHIAVQCEREPTVQLLGPEQSRDGVRLVPCGHLALPHPPLDMSFDPQGRLWVLVESGDAPLHLFTHRQGGWRRDAESAELSRVTEGLKPHWGALQASAGAESRYRHLFKVSFDNMASYRQKKQQRLEQQQGLRGKKRTAGGEGQKANGAARKKKKEKEVKGEKEVREGVKQATS